MRAASAFAWPSITVFCGPRVGLGRAGGAVGVGGDVRGLLAALALVVRDLLRPLAADALGDAAAHRLRVAEPADADVDDLDAVLGQRLDAQVVGQRSSSPISRRRTRSVRSSISFTSSARNLGASRATAGTADERRPCAVCMSMTPMRSVDRHRADDRREPAVDERAENLLRLFRGADGRKNRSAASASGIFHVTDASTASVLSTVPVTGSRVSDSTAGRSNDCTRRSMRWTESTGHGALMCRPRRSRRRGSRPVRRTA